MTGLDKLDPKDDGGSLDVVAENLDQMRELFPEAFVEDKIDLDVLRDLLGEYVEDRQERYGFTWHGKSSARRIAQTSSTGTLRPCPGDSLDWDGTQNIFIEGDNLEVLKLLQKSYYGRVKMIYIDPPYNTGKEFIYPDKFQDNLDTYLRYTGQVSDEGFKLSANTEQQGRYHTNWLNMMYPRLRLARNLLSEDGVIFISIDDHEVANLRKVCDELFGEENFVATIVWQKKYAPQNDAANFTDMHDYILVYARSARASRSDAEGWAIDLLPRTEAQDAAYKNPDDDPRGPWKASDLTSKTKAKGHSYPITSPRTGKTFLPSSGRQWAPSLDTFKRLMAENRIWFGPDGNSMPALKRFRSDVMEGRVPVTWWTYEECGHNQEAKQELKSLMGDDALIFDTPKPVRLITRLLQLATKSDPDAIVLDFFAGSGTTAHAVMKFNTLDGGRRRCISVQLPEPIEGHRFNTIADLTRERLRKAAKSLSSDSRTGVDLGYRAFKLDSSNITAWDPSPDNLTESLWKAVTPIKEDRSEEDLVAELMLKLGLDLGMRIETREVGGKTLHVAGGGALVICVSPEMDLDIAEAIISIKQDLNPSVMQVVVHDGGFENDVAKTNFVQALVSAGIADVKSL